MNSFPCIYQQQKLMLMLVYKQEDTDNKSDYDSSESLDDELFNLIEKDVTKQKERDIYSLFFYPASDTVRIEYFGPRIRSYENGNSSPDPHCFAYGRTGVLSNYYCPEGKSF